MTSLAGVASCTTEKKTWIDYAATELVVLFRRLRASFALPYVGLAGG
jgi:hypothetical protein